MNLELLKKSNKIIYEVVGGSFAYATNIETSDKDIRGLYINDNSDYLGLDEPVMQIGDETHDIVYYSLKRFFNLIKTANPNLIELLWIPQDCVLKSTPISDKLIENRHLFISKKAYFTHSGYAHAQISKATGANKMVKPIILN
jgi:predicted nucleotidyltransferase